MNKQAQFTVVLILVVCLTVGTLIGVTAGTYLFNLTHPEAGASETTDEPTGTASSSDSQTAGQTTAKPSKPEDETPKKKIALTFDDGPSAAYTGEILDLLEQYRAKATFFVCGNRLNENTKAVFQRAIALGCEIGNHTVSHKYLTELSEQELLQEIRDTNEKIAQYSGNDYKCIYYRPPGGFINRSVVDKLCGNGVYMYPIFWSSDSLDWQYQSRYQKGEITRDEAVTGAFDTIVRETKEGTVILMHDIKEITPDILKLVLEKYDAEGYEFVTVSELFGLKENASDKDAYYNRYRATDSILPIK